jgi:arylsulfatase A-like enzyme
MKPNILMIHCHDLGDFIGCYEGNCADTPNLNKLAEEGVVFANHFASSPTCSPSRGTMLTGLMPHRNGLMGLASGGHWEMDKNILTLPGILKDAGYETVNFGTWHISADPKEYGIDISDKSEHSCEETTGRGTEYLESFSCQKPFFLRVGFNEPHLPFKGNWPDLKNIESVDVPDYLTDCSTVREQLSLFYGDISSVDACVGRLMNCLEDLSLKNKTIVVFTADHGPGLPFAKCTLYDAGIKIPLIIRCNGGISDERRFEGLSSNADFMPTLLELVGEKKRIPDFIDGVSMSSFMTGSKIVEREYVFAEQTWHDFYEPVRAIRGKRYKLIRNFLPGKGLQVGADMKSSPCGKIMEDSLNEYKRPEYELYDLTKDTSEKENLAGSEAYSSVEKKLKNKLNSWLKETRDPILEDTVKAPQGYWEHFWAKPDGPGGFMGNCEQTNYFKVKWPKSGIKHKCPK